MSKKGHLASMCARQRPVFIAEGRSWEEKKYRCTKKNNYRPHLLLNDVRLLRLRHFVLKEEPFDLGDKVENASTTSQEMARKEIQIQIICLKPPENLWLSTSNLPGCKPHPFPQHCLHLHSQGKLGMLVSHSTLITFSEQNKNRYWHWITQVIVIINVYVCRNIQKNSELKKKKYTNKRGPGLSAYPFSRTALLPGVSTRQLLCNFAHPALHLKHHGDIEETKLCLPSSRSLCSTGAYLYCSKFQILHRKKWL